MSMSNEYRSALATIPGVGAIKLDRYADEVLALLGGSGASDHDDGAGEAAIQEALSMDETE